LPFPVPAHRAENVFGSRQVRQCLVRTVLRGPQLRAQAVSDAAVATVFAVRGARMFQHLVDQRLRFLVAVGVEAGLRQSLTHSGSRTPVLAAVLHRHCQGTAEYRQCLVEAAELGEEFTQLRVRLGQAFGRSEHDQLGGDFAHVRQSAFVAPEHRCDRSPVAERGESFDGVGLSELGVLGHRSLGACQRLLDTAHLRQGDRQRDQRIRSIGVRCASQHAEFTNGLFERGDRGVRLSLLALESCLQRATGAELAEKPIRPRVPERLRGAEQTARILVAAAMVHDGCHARTRGSEDFGVALDSGPLQQLFKQRRGSFRVAQCGIQFAQHQCGRLSRFRLVPEVLEDLVRALLQYRIRGQRIRFVPLGGVAEHECEIVADRVRACDFGYRLLALQAFVVRAAQRDRGRGEQAQRGQGRDAQ
jgi:hypothetical protein